MRSPTTASHKATQRMNKRTIALEHLVVQITRVFELILLCQIFSQGSNGVKKMQKKKKKKKKVTKCLAHMEANKAQIRQKLNAKWPDNTEHSSQTIQNAKWPDRNRLQTGQTETECKVARQKQNTKWPDRNRMQSGQTTQNTKWPDNTECKVARQKWNVEWPDKNRM